MIDGVTLVQAGAGTLGLPSTCDLDEEATDGPTVAVTLRSTNRTETVVAALRSAETGRMAPLGSFGLDRADDHLLADVNGADVDWLRLSDIIVQMRETECPQEWLSEMFDRYRGCAVGAVVARGGGLVGLRDGRAARLIPEAGGGRSETELTACASFVHAWLANEREFAMLDQAVLRLVRSAGVISLRLDVDPPQRVRLETTEFAGERESARPGVLPQR